MENKPKKNRIVLADDEVFITAAYKDGLERAGFEVRVAHNGEEAVKLVKADKPDILLLDLIMPIMTGFEVLKALRAEEAFKDLPIAIMSNLSQGVDEKEAKESGATDFIVKSDYSLKQVIERINQLLGN